MPSLEEKYPDLKKTFPEEFSYLFNDEGEPNSRGVVYAEVLELRAEKLEFKKQLNQLVDDDLENLIESLKKSGHVIRSQQALDIQYMVKEEPRPICTIFVGDRYIQFHDEFTQLGCDIPELKSLIDAGWDNNHT